MKTIERRDEFEDLKKRLPPTEKTTFEKGIYSLLRPSKRIITTKSREGSKILAPFPLSALEFSRQELFEISDIDVANVKNLSVHNSLLNLMMQEKPDQKRPYQEKSKNESEFLREKTGSNMKTSDNTTKVCPSSTIQDLNARSQSEMDNNEETYPISCNPKLPKPQNGGKFVPKDLIFEKITRETEAIVLEGAETISKRSDKSLETAPTPEVNHTCLVTSKKQSPNISNASSQVFGEKEMEPQVAPSARCWEDSVSLPAESETKCLAPSIQYTKANHLKKVQVEVPTLAKVSPAEKDLPANSQGQLRNSKNMKSAFSQEQIMIVASLICERTSKMSDQNVSADQVRVFHLVKNYIADIDDMIRNHEQDL